MKHRLLWMLQLVLPLVLGLGLVGLVYLRVGSKKTSEPDSRIQRMDMTSWRSVPGVTSATSDSVHLEPIDLKIVNQDGSGGQENPPVNVYGQYLAHNTADFTITMPINAVGAEWCELSLYQSPPVIYDEWRQETPSVRLRLQGKSLQVRVWDGSGEQPSFERSVVISQAQSRQDITVSRRGNRIMVSTGSEQIAVVAPEVLAGDRLWFGAQAGGASWIIGQISSTGGAAFETIKQIDNNAGGLKTLVAQQGGSLRVGAAVASYPLFSDEAYRNIAVSEFSQWTTENELKAQFVQPAQGQFTFGPADAVVDHAKQHNIVVHGHALVFGEANPKWMQMVPKEQKQQVMIEHITELVTHYKGKVQSWDVVNEPFSDRDQDYRGNGLRRHMWYQAMGEDYIETAFRTAHAADPDAKLFLNDYGLEADGERWDTLIALLKRLQAKGVPIDGIGFQSHIYEEGDHVDQAVLTRHIQVLAELGLDARISEIDVHGDDPQAQAEQYSEVLQACLSQSTCTSFTTWGISDKYGSTTNDHVYPAEFGDDLLWDAELTHKQAYVKIQKILKGWRN